MAYSDSSDSSRERRQRKKGKKDRHRPRSRSSSSDRSQKYRSSYHKSSRSRKHSRSRERQRSRSRSRDRSYKYRDRSRSRDVDKNRRSKKHSSDESDSFSKYKTDVTTGKDEKLSLKEKVKALTVSGLQTSQQIVPTYAQVEMIDKESFVQKAFSSTSILNNSGNQPKQKKKKKKRNQKLLLQQKLSENTQENKVDIISHENAIFGTAVDTMHIGKFTSRIDTKRKEELKSVETDDLIFGALFCEKPEVRMKRWIDKLTLIRKQIREKEQVETI